MKPCPKRDAASIDALLQERGVRAVSWNDWRAIDAAEVKNGEAGGKPREKFTRIQEMLDVLG